MRQTPRIGIIPVGKGDGGNTTHASLRILDNELKESGENDAKSEKAFARDLQYFMHTRADKFDEQFASTLESGNSIAEMLTAASTPPAGDRTGGDPPSGEEPSKAAFSRKSFGPTENSRIVHATHPHEPLYTGGTNYADFVRKAASDNSVSSMHKTVLDYFFRPDIIEAIPADLVKAELQTFRGPGTLLGKGSQKRAEMHTQPPAGAYKPSPGVVGTGARVDWGRNPLETKNAEKRRNPVDAYIFDTEELLQNPRSNARYEALMRTIPHELGIIRTKLGSELSATQKNAI